MVRLCSIPLTETGLSDLRARLQDGLAGAYTLERELGRVGMAIVFLARDLKHDREVAIKVVRLPPGMNLA